MTRLLVLLALVVALPASAQVTITPAGALGGGTLPVTAFPLLAPDGTLTAPSYSFVNEPALGLYRQATGTIAITAGNGTSVSLGTFSTANFNFVANSGTILTLNTNTQAILRDTAALGWGSTATATPDLFLYRQGIGSLFQRNSTNAQRFDIANTYTGTTNFESFSVDWQTNANVAVVGTRSAATGNGRRLLVGAQGQNASTTYSGIAFFRGSSGPPDADIRLGIFSADGATVGSSGVTALVKLGEYTSTATSGTVVPVAITPAYNQIAATTSNTDLLINRTETNIGSGTQFLIDAQVGGVTAFNVSRAGSISNLGNVNLLSAGALLNLQGSIGLATGNTAPGNQNGYTFKVKNITAIADAAATATFTVTVPNAAHAATLDISYSCSLGAGGAIGAFEATGTINHIWSITRTAGVATATSSANYGANNAAVVGAATLTLTTGSSAISGAVGATQTFTPTITVTRGSGASTNHTCRATAALINANGTGITLQ